MADPPNAVPAPPAPGDAVQSPGDAVAIETARAGVDKWRALTGLLVVAIGDAAIAVAAILGVVIVKNSSASSASVVSILTSAFTAIGTLTTAYFGIRAASNTAQTSISRPVSLTDGAHQTSGGSPA